MKKCFEGSFIVAFVLIVLFIAVEYGFAVSPVSYANPRKYHVRHTACCYNKNITTLTRLELNVPLPENWPDCTVSNLNIIGDKAFQLHNTEGPGQIVRVVYKDGLPKRDTLVSLVVEYDIELNEVKTDVDALLNKTYPPYEKDKDYEYYTRIPIEMHPDDSEYRNLVKSFQAQAHDNPAVFAKAVFDWVKKNITYANPRPSADLDICFKARKGDCGAIAQFFARLCRIGGVPVRFVAGCWAGEMNGVHCWAEFYLPQVGWVPIDHSPAGDFGYLSNNHLPLVKAGNMKFNVNENQGGKECGFIQPGTWFFWFSGGSEGTHIAPEFDIASYAIDLQQQKANEDIKEQFKTISNALRDKQYDQAIKLGLQLSRHDLPPEMADAVRYNLAKSYFAKDAPIMASSWLLPMLKQESKTAASHNAESLLKQIRSQDLHLSELNLGPIRQGWGQPHVNQSVDGRPISIGGRRFEKGIGTHSESICVIQTNNSIKEFSAFVGVDDEVKGQGSVEFFVLGDGSILWQSGVMKGGDAPKQVCVKIKEVKKLVLKVTDAGDGSICDHADWADAQVKISGIYPSIIAPE